MILAFDVGNTNIVLGLVEDGNVVNSVRMRTEINATGSEYAIKLSDFLNLMGADRKDIAGAIISSTVPAVVQPLANAVKAITGHESLVVDTELKSDMEVLLDNPREIGADLITGGVAAKACYGAPAIVIDLGTATTVTVVDCDGNFGGGVIVPGVKLSLDALASGTSLLPHISLTAPEKVIGTNTVNCMRSGSVYGTAYMIDGIIDAMEEELGSKCVHVATGGLASSIVGHCRHDVICDDDLLLKGLWVLYEKNR